MTVLAIGLTGVWRADGALRDVHGRRQGVQVNAAGGRCRVLSNDTYSEHVQATAKLVTCYRTSKEDFAGWHAFQARNDRRQHVSSPGGVTPVSARTTVI